ncbi:MAG: lyase family protein, partial [Gammaproteobacteria bacterium]
MRIEKDSLGTIELADDIYYGIQTARAVENFPISGTKLHPIMVTAYLWIKIAAAKTNGELGTIDGKIARAIVQAGEEALSGKFDKYFVVDAFQAGAGTSFNMNANEVLANRACELLGGQKGDSKLVSPNDHVNRGQSTNDTFPAAMRVAILKLSEKLLPSLQLLTDELKRKGEEFGSVAKSGRTHMQDAVPITLGREFMAYAGYLERSRERLDQALSNLQYSNLGGTAVG